MESGLGFSVGICLTRNVLPLPRGAMLLFSVQHPAVKLAAVYLSSAAVSILPGTGKKILSGKKTFNILSPQNTSQAKS